VLRAPGAHLCKYYILRPVEGPAKAKHCVALAGNTAIMAQLLLLLETAAIREFLATMEVGLRGRKIRGKRSRGNVAERGQGTGRGKRTVSRRGREVL
jgi:hypothetical protein